jgi:hypothetical protein
MSNTPSALGTSRKGRLFSNLKIAQFTAPQNEKGGCNAAQSLLIKAGFAD